MRKKSGRLDRVDEIGLDNENEGDHDGKKIIYIII